MLTTKTFRTLNQEQLYAFFFKRRKMIFLIILDDMRASTAVVGPALSSVVNFGNQNKQKTSDPTFPEILFFNRLTLKCGFLNDTL